MTDWWNLQSGSPLCLGDNTILSSIILSFVIRMSFTRGRQALRRIPKAALKPHESLGNGFQLGLKFSMALV